MQYPAFTLVSALGLSDVGSRASPTFVDIDEDGDSDAFVGNDAGETVFFENIGTTNSPAFASPETNPFNLSGVGSRASPTFVDIDGDGNSDAFISTGESETLFFENIGTASNPAFAALETNPFGLNNAGWYANPVFADIDGDGDLDAFMGDYGNTLFFRNTGTANNPVFAVPESNPFGLKYVENGANPNFVDIDGDGDLDAFINSEFFSWGYGYSGGETLFFENVGTVSNPAFAVPEIDFFGLEGLSIKSCICRY